ncbi:hypothetical protein [Butyricimonas paravirosa]
MKITLKKKKLTTGKFSLYIEYYKGKIVDAEGNVKHNRDFEYLNGYIVKDDIESEYLILYHCGNWG